MGGRMSRNLDTYPGRTETLLTRAREKLGADAILMADANGSYDVPLTAFASAGWMESLNYCLLRGAVPV